MIKKFYKKLYFYTLLILLISTVLTTFTVHLITRKNFEHSLKVPFGANLILLSAALLEAHDEEPNNLPNKILNLEKLTGWDISYWQGNKCLYECNQEHLSVQQKVQFSKLLSEKKEQAIDRKESGPILMGYLNSREPAKGIVMVSLNNFPPPHQRIKVLVLTGLFILLFLGLFLLPYTRFVLKPFKELMKSINYISDGNFTKMIEVSEKNEFSEIAENFNNIILKIREMMHHKERMIADVSHELRTPLAKIRLAQELLLKEGKGNLKYINRSIEETENLDKLINDLLDASELELNPDKFKLSKLDFNEILRENIEKNKMLFEQKGLKINTKFSEKPIVVKVERLLIERAFNNIFSNIIKYAPGNSEVDLFLKEENSKALLTVRDYGPGVNEEYLGKIFEPFYRTDESRTRETGGTGLGLAIVKKILELHGGNIWASSANDNKGGLILNLVMSVTK